MKDIEGLLRRYTPVGPPDELRQRILAGARARRAWPWVAAAAALLITAVGLRAATAFQVADMPFGPSPVARVIDDLAIRLGGDAVARQMAIAIVVEVDEDMLAPGADSLGVGGLQP